MNIQIEQGIPMPPVKYRLKGLTKIFREMKVGDSIQLPLTTGFYNIAKQVGIKVKTQKSDHGLIRVWRIE